MRLDSGLGVRLIEAGPAEGRPIFLVHGWGCSVFSFRHTIPALAAAGFRVLAADLKGHGQSDKPLGADEYRMDALVANVVEILDAVGLSRASMVGHSLGGAIAARVALAQPERIERLALISPVGLGRVRLVRSFRILPSQLAPVLPYMTSRALFGVALRLAYGPGVPVPAGVVDEYWAPTRDPSFIPALYALLREMDWKPLGDRELRAMQSPTLVILGTRDLIVPPHAPDRFRRSLRESEIVLIPGAGHALQEADPAATNAALLRFLGRS